MINVSCFSLTRDLIFALLFKQIHRDLRLHKLVFEEDVLPDGTELAYYANGEVALIENGFFFTYFFIFIFSECAFVLCSETVGWLQKRIWNLLYLLQH